MSANSFSILLFLTLLALVCYGQEEVDFSEASGAIGAGKEATLAFYGMINSIRDNANRHIAADEAVVDKKKELQREIDFAKAKYQEKYNNTAKLLKVELDNYYARLNTSLTEFKSQFVGQKEQFEAKWKEERFKAKMHDRDYAVTTLYGAGLAAFTCFVCLGNILCYRIACKGAVQHEEEDLSVIVIQQNVEQGVNPVSPARTPVVATPKK